MGYTERPMEALLDLLYNAGAYKVGLKHFLERRKVQEFGYQYVAVEMLVREQYLVSDPLFRGSPLRDDVYRGARFRLLSPGGEEGADAVLSRSEYSSPILSWRDLLELLPAPPTPAVTVDLGALALSSEDPNVMRVQIRELIERVREYLWDPHLAITSADRGFMEWVSMIVGRNKITITQSRPSELLWSMDADKVVILRQDAPYALTPHDVLSSEAFLVGMPQEKALSPIQSRMLDNLVPWGLPRRVELRNSVVGVPESINKMVEMVLKARYKYGGDIEKAVISSMTQKNVVSRLYYEIMKAAKKGVGSPYVTWELYEDLCKWLPVTREDFEKVAEKLGVRIRDGSL
ncbi:MAG: tRNA (guanine-N1)-methyltransferase [Acidilobaceae archaeon]